MEFLEKVKKTVASVAAVSVREGKKVSAIAKLKIEVADKQNKVKALYKEIGYEAYKAHTAGEDILASIQPKLVEIDIIEKEIAELRVKIASVKNTDEVGVEDVETADEDAVEADVVDEDIETEPIDPIE